LHFDNKELACTLKCAKYWKDRFASIGRYPSEDEKAEYLLSQWKGFPAFVSRGGDVPERCIMAFKGLVFRTALGIYESLIDASVTGVKDGDLLMRIGRCYKALGEYDKALQYLDAAKQIKKENAEIIAELAEWMPVYGVLFNVLNIKRELRPIEYGKLRQSIYTMEMEMREMPQKKEESLARLINRYFWLIDHYRMTKESREKIEEVMLKIRELSPALYEEYTK
jgi:tetratricopeptide (TPR) repeat protein